MAESNALVLIFLVAIAAPATSTFSARSWYCHRLAPRFITYAVTPCRYPCLVVSAHVHPHIILQNEPDGTPCMTNNALHHEGKTNNALHHEGKIGICRNNFCVQELPHEVLKRKKRFICLYALARIISLKKQRRKLEDQIGQLQQQLDNNRNRDGDNHWARRVEESGTGGAEGFGGDIAGADGGGDYGPEYFPSATNGAINSGFGGMGGARPDMRGVGPSGVGGGPSSGGGMDVAGVPHNTNTRGGPIGGGGDGASDTAQVRLRDGGDTSGTSDAGRVDSVGSATESVGGSEGAYFG